MARIKALLICSLMSFGIYAQDTIITANDFEEIEHLFSDETNEEVWVINFWATWCSPCLAELPYFKSAAKILNPAEVRFIFVTLDFKKQFESKLKPYLAEHPLPGTVYNLWDMDYNSWIDQVSPKWSGAIPVTVIRKGDEKIVLTSEVESTEELMESIASISQ